MGVAEHAPDARADFPPSRWRQAAGSPFSIGNFMHCPTSDPPPPFHRQTPLYKIGTCPDFDSGRQCGGFRMGGCRVVDKLLLLWRSTSGMGA